MVLLVLLTATFNFSMPAITDSKVNHNTVGQQGEEPLTQKSNSPTRNLEKSFLERNFAQATALHGAARRGTIDTRIKFTNKKSREMFS